MKSDGGLRGGGGGVRVRMESLVRWCEYAEAGGWRRKIGDVVVDAWGEYAVSWAMRTRAVVAVSEDE